MSLAEEMRHLTGKMQVRGKAKRDSSTTQADPSAKLRAGAFALCEGKQRANAEEKVGPLRSE